MAHGAFRKGFPGGASGKEHACLCRRQKRRGFHPWVGKVPWRRGYGKPLQCSCLENPMDRGAWRAAVHCVTKSRTRLSNRAFRKMEREKAPGLGWCEVVGPRGCKSPWGGGSAAFVPPSHVWLWLVRGSNLGGPWSPPPPSLKGPEPGTVGGWWQIAGGAAHLGQQARRLPTSPCPLKHPGVSCAAPGNSLCSPRAWRSGLAPTPGLPLAQVYPSVLVLAAGILGLRSGPVTEAIWLPVPGGR